MYFVCKKHDIQESQLAEISDIELLKKLDEIKAHAEYGIVVPTGEVGLFEDEWYEEEEYSGDKALDVMGFRVYEKEAIKRGLITER